MPDTQIISSPPPPSFFVPIDVHEPSADHDNDDNVTDDYVVPTTTILPSLPLESLTTSSPEVITANTTPAHNANESSSSPTTSITTLLEASNDTTDVDTIEKLVKGDVDIQRLVLIKTISEQSRATSSGGKMSTNSSNCCTPTRKGLLVRSSSTTTPTTSPLPENGTVLLNPFLFIQNSVSGVMNVSTGTEINNNNHNVVVAGTTFENESQTTSDDEDEEEDEDEVVLDPATLEVVHAIKRSYATKKSSTRNNNRNGITNNTATTLLPTTGGSSGTSSDLNNLDRYKYVTSRKFKVILSLILCIIVGIIISVPTAFMNMKDRKPSSSTPSVPTIPTTTTTGATGGGVVSPTKPNGDNNEEDSGVVVGATTMSPSVSPTPDYVVKMHETSVFANTIWNTLLQSSIIQNQKNVGLSALHDLNSLQYRVYSYMVVEDRDYLAQHVFQTDLTTTITTRSSEIQVSEQISKRILQRYTLMLLDASFEKKYDDNMNGMNRNRRNMQEEQEQQQPSSLLRGSHIVHDNDRDLKGFVLPFIDTTKSECEWFGITCADANNLNITYNATEVLMSSSLSYSNSTTTTDDDEVVSTTNNSTTTGGVPTEWVVTGVAWPGRGLRGKLPHDIVNLKHSLQVLDFNTNEISGTIPHVLLEQCTQLEELILHSNQFTGTLPTQIGLVQSLRKLFLGNNELHGTLPIEIGSPTMGIGNARPLHYINLYNNSFHGPLPSNLNLGLLTYLDLGYNDFTGTIPVDWVDGTNSMRMMRHFYVDHNQLNGSLPDTFPNLGLSRVHQVLLNDNQFTGSYSFSGGYTVTTKLNTLHIHHNSFQTLDENICKMSVYSEGELTDLTADCSACPCKDNCYNCVSD